MKCLLVAINAKFIHTNLAIRCLSRYALSFGEVVEMEEYTINHRVEEILADIYEKRPDVICFSCYIWNDAIVCALASDLKKILPSCRIVLGGPQVSYDSIEVLEKNQAVDIVLRGEGEKTFYELILALSSAKSIASVLGLTFREGKNIIENPPRPALSLDEIPFAYQDLSGLSDKILYYETQRGCPYQCQYCLSSVEAGVRFLSFSRVEKNLQFFLERRVKQVKFVDRTFNANRTHARNIWTYLMEHDNGITNFHMEITGDLLLEEDITLLAKARQGLLQFEIGVQSTNEDTLAYIRRKTDSTLLFQKIRELQKAGNIHIHLDLIAGLPKEGYESFKCSFNAVYALSPQQFQLGFLKLLKGAGLREQALACGIVYRESAPYEVLCTPDLSYEQILRLKAVEDMVEIYFNSGKALYSLRYMIPFFASAFDFFEALGCFWKAKSYHKAQHKKMELFTILLEFMQEQALSVEQIRVLKEVLCFDILLADNLRELPQSLNTGTDEKYLTKKREFYAKGEKNCTVFFKALAEKSKKQILALTAIRVFAYDVTDTLLPVLTPLLFYYGDKQVSFCKIPLTIEEENLNE